MVTPRSRPRLRWAAVVLAAVLLVTPRLQAQTEPPPDRNVSKLQYVVRGTFLLSLLVIGFVLVRAAMSGSDDTTRLRAATDKVDRALGPGRTGAAPDRGANHTRSDAGRQGARRAAVETRLVPARALRLPNH